MTQDSELVDGPDGDRSSSFFSRIFIACKIG